MKVTYIITKNGKTIKTTTDELEAISYAKHIGGEAFERHQWTDKFGYPCSRDMRWSEKLNMWVNA